MVVVPRNSPPLAIPTAKTQVAAHTCLHTQGSIFSSATACGGTEAQPGMCVHIQLSKRTMVDRIGPTETDKGSSASA